MTGYSLTGRPLSCSWLLGTDKAPSMVGVDFSQGDACFFHWAWWFILVHWVRACGDCRNISPLEWFHFTRQVMWSREGWWIGLDYSFVGSFIWNSLCEVRPQNVWSQGTEKSSSPCPCLPNLPRSCSVLILWGQAERVREEQKEGPISNRMI